MGNIFPEYGAYLLNYFFPFELSFFYPYPSQDFLHFSLPVSFLFIGPLTVWVFIKRKRFPYLFLGWFWFLTGLIPVIGIIQVGYQFIADRYMYLPSTGITILLVLFLFRVFKNKKIPFCLLVLFSFYLFVLSKSQIKYWQNSFTLFNRALTVTEDNFMAHNNLGAAYFYENDLQKAAFHFQEAIKIFKPNYKAHINLSEVYFREKQYEKAAVHLKEALRINPDLFESYMNLGIAYYQLNDFDQAVSSLQKAVQIKPSFAKAHFTLGLIYWKTGKKSLASEEAEILRKQDPELARKLEGRFS